MEGKRKGEKVTREHRLKKETCLLQRVHLGVVTGRSAGVQLAGPLSSEQDCQVKEPCSNQTPAKAPCCEHSSSPSFPKPERKDETKSNFMSSAGKSNPIERFYQEAHPSDSPEWLRHIFGPTAGGRHEELKT